MSTNTNPTPETPASSLKPLDLSGDSLVTEKITYRGYGKLNEKGEKTDFQAKSQVANNVNWGKLEAGGYTQLNEVEFIKYNLKTMHGFELLVPDEQQRIYISQAGLNYIQNSKANSIMSDFKDDGVTPVNDGLTIDLREAINEPPSKRQLTDQQKLERLVKSMGLSMAETEALFADLKKSFAAQAAAAAANPQLEAENEAEAPTPTDAEAVA